jgi:hypothetical protein
MLHSAVIFRPTRFSSALCVYGREARCLGAMASLFVLYILNLLSSSREVNHEHHSRSHKNWIHDGHLLYALKLGP